MIALEQCVQIVNQNGDVRYTKDEVKSIREFLYLMARLQQEINDIKKRYE